MKAIILTIVLFTNVFNIEVASTRAEKEKGMMYRKSWGSIDGMLFLNKQPEQVSYWMKNTYLPMEMIFLDEDCNVMEMAYPKPLSTDLVISQNTNIMYVLELKPELTNLLTVQNKAFLKKMKSQVLSLEND